MTHRGEGKDSATERERTHLEELHHEVCTAATVVLSNVALVRIDLQKEDHSPPRVRIQGHLHELDEAADRLRIVSRTMRTWHDEHAADAHPLAPATSQRRPAGVMGRFHASARQFGFVAPPVTLQLKIQKGAHHWSLFLQPLQASSLAPLVGWLEPWSPLRVEFGSRHVLRADFDPAPEPWGTLFRPLELDKLALAPSGDADAWVRGPRCALAKFAHQLAAHHEPVEIRSVTAEEPTRDWLTRAQREALHEAVRAGYYQIPRPLNLRDLASHMHISAAALSERLRRAEGHVIKRFDEQGGVTPWDARTLFDESDADAALAPPENAERAR